MGEKGKHRKTGQNRGNHRETTENIGKKRKNMGKQENRKKQGES